MMYDAEPSHHETVAIRKSGIEGWSVFKWERAGDDLIMTGGVGRRLKSGPNAGRMTWKDCKPSMVVVTQAEVRAQVAEYERTTGNCHACFGKRETFKSWSHNEGTKYQPCKTCGATGKATK